MKKQQWVFREDNLTVEFFDELGRNRYYVDLEKCRTSAAMLDWIMQVAGKAWATAEVVGDLVLMLDHLLRPQECLCSSGHERGPIKDVAKRIEALRHQDAEAERVFGHIVHDLDLRKQEFARNGKRTKDLVKAECVLKKYYWGQQWQIPKCPLCGGKHAHGAGEPTDDPLKFLGPRVSHCDDIDEDYVLVEMVP